MALTIKKVQYNKDDTVKVICVNDAGEKSAHTVTVTELTEPTEKPAGTVCFAKPTE